MSTGQGRRDRYLLKSKYQTWKCSKPEGFMIGDTVVQSECSGRELSTVDDRKRYFVGSYQLEEKNHINMTVTGN